MTTGDEKLIKSSGTSCIGLKSVPQRSCLHGSYKCDLIWKRGLWRCYQVNMRSYWIRAGLKFNTADVLIRRERFGHRHTEGRRTRGGGDKDWSYTSTNQGKLRIASDQKKLEEVRKDSVLEPQKGWPCRHLGFGLLASRTLKE